MSSATRPKHTDVKVNFGRCLLTAVLPSLRFALLLDLLLFFSYFYQKKLVFPAVMIVLDELPIISSYHYCLVRDHSL